MHKIELTPYVKKTVPLGKYSAMTYNGMDIGYSNKPIYDAARYLLDNGLATAEDTIATYRGKTKCMSGMVGVAATKDITEGKGVGPKRIKYSPHPWSEKE